MESKALVKEKRGRVIETPRACCCSVLSQSEKEMERDKETPDCVERVRSELESARESESESGSESESESASESERESKKQESRQNQGQKQIIH